MEDVNIAKWIKEARAHAKLSQQALGDFLGKTKGNISAWENGRHEPSFKQLIRVSELTGWPLPQKISTQAYGDVEQKPTAKEIQPVESANTKKANASSLDMSNLKEAISAALEINKEGELNLSPEKMAVLVAFWYEEWTEQGQHKPTLTEANRILRLVA